MRNREPRMVNEDGRSGQPCHSRPPSARPRRPATRQREQKPDRKGGGGASRTGRTTCRPNETARIATADPHSSPLVPPPTSAPSVPHQATPTGSKSPRVAARGPSSCHSLLEGRRRAAPAKQRASPPGGRRRAAPAKQRASPPGGRRRVASAKQRAALPSCTGDESCG